MKRKMKITISALAVMFVAAIAVAIASFSFAGNGDKDDLLEDSEILADASGSVGEKTIIDYIIGGWHRQWSAPSQSLSYCGDNIFRNAVFFGYVCIFKWI